MSRKAGASVVFINQYFKIPKLQYILNSLVAASVVVIFSKLMLVCCGSWYLCLKASMLNSITLLATRVLKRPVLTDLWIQFCKTLIELSTGGKFQ